MTLVDPWHDDLPQDLLATAYRSGAELAWRRSDALGVMAALHAAGWPVIGVDIWLAREGGPTPYAHDWSADGSSNDPLYRGSAENFVRNFDWDPKDGSHEGAEPWFNFVVGDKGGGVDRAGA